MSSRALRKAQKERERRNYEETLEHDGTDGPYDDEVEPTAAPSRPSMFSMLNMEDGDISDDDESGEVEAQNELPRFASLTVADVASTDDDETAASSKFTGGSPAHKDLQRKRKKKKKSKKSSPAPSSIHDNFPKNVDSVTARDYVSADDVAVKEVCKLLSIDTQHLQVANEMRRLFGRAAFQEDEHQSTTEQRRTQEGGVAGLAEAVSGRMAYGGPGLPAVLRRRNIFASGREDWPRSTGGGLGMEVVETKPGDITEYRFVHNAAYQGAQKEFHNCVAGMDPNSMVNLLRFNPYHVSTLLQVSEIAKQEKDYATSGLLLERALFSFGRAVHSSFAGKLAQGSARLDFRRPENREFWLTVWKYIGSLGMRSTWRTAYEWARLLLSLDPEGDHYCISLVIDQYAIRARQPESFLELVHSKFFAEKWQHLPNIRFSASLAAKINGGRADCQISLIKAMENYPWVAARLLQELGVEKTPPAMWGKMPGSEKDVFHTELYATLAKDLWKTPEAFAFLNSSAALANDTSLARLPNPEPITLDEARYVVLTDRPALIALVPRSITSRVDSMSDPLPPLDNHTSYTSGLDDWRSVSGVGGNRNTLIDPEQLIVHDPSRFIREVDELQSFFEYMVPGFSQSEVSSNEYEAAAITDETVEQAMARANLPIAQLRLRMTRFVQLREALSAQPGRRVSTTDGEEAVMTGNGFVRVVSSQEHSESA